MATKILDTFVSVIIVADDITDNIVKKTTTVASLLKKNYANYEVIIIDNGISFKKTESLRKMLKEVACVRIIQLAKISDTDTAVFAGVEAAIGDCVCILYNNDPEKYIPEVINKLNTGHNIVFGVATNLRRKNLFENIGAKFFYWYNRRFLNIEYLRATYFRYGQECRKCSYQKWKVLKTHTVFN